MAETFRRSMSAVEISRPGGPEVLVLVQRAIPRPGPGEVLIRVAAAGVNRPDILQRRGHYPPPLGASDLPGLEVSGTVVELGEGATTWAPGDRVCALLAGGGYAEYAAAPEAQCLGVPRGVDVVAAAGIPEVFFTVWANVYERGRLAPGETLLVHGGSSGIGTAAIQLGRALGSRVFATAGTTEKCTACEGLGAERAINYRTEDFVPAVQDLTQGRGVDVVLDMVGGPYVARNLAVLAVEGRLVQIAFLEGSKVELDLQPVLRRRLTVTGSSLRPRSVSEKGAIARAVKENVWPLFESGRIRPVVHARFPLTSAAKAHELMEAGAHIGKILLVTGTGELEGTPSGP